MNIKLHKIAIASLMVMVIGIFSMNAFGQSREQRINEVTNLINYYGNRIVQLTNYRAQLREYYKYPAYRRWASQEDNKAFNALVEAQQYHLHYTRLRQGLLGASVYTDCGGGIQNNGICGYGGQGGFAGTFYSSEGKTFTFQQNGDKIDGRYSKGNDWGVIRGGVSGNRLRAGWNNHSGMINGEIIFILRSDGNIEGKWCFNQGCDPTKGTYFTATRQ